MIKMIVHLNPEEILNFKLFSSYCSLIFTVIENNPDVICIFHLLVGNLFYAVVFYSSLFAF